MDLSQKYNLGLEKLSISQESLESLQTKFPKPTQNNFFDDLKTALDATQNLEDNTIPKAATTNIMTLLDKQPSKPEPAEVYLHPLIRNGSGHWRNFPHLYLWWKTQHPSLH